MDTYKILEFVKEHTMLDKCEEQSFTTYGLVKLLTEFDMMIERERAKLQPPTEQLQQTDVSNSDDATSYGGKLFSDMTKDELIVIVKHLCSVLKKIQKMDENIDYQVKKTINILKSENNFLRRLRWW